MQYWFSGDDSGDDSGDEALTPNGDSESALKFHFLLNSYEESLQHLLIVYATLRLVIK